MRESKRIGNPCSQCKCTLSPDTNEKKSAGKFKLIISELKMGNMVFNQRVMDEDTPKKYDFDNYNVESDKSWL